MDVFQALSGEAGRVLTRAIVACEAHAAEAIPGNVALVVACKKTKNT
jgi:hypothetical protein